MVATWLAADRPTIPGWTGWEDKKVAQQVKDAIVQLAWQRASFPNGFNPQKEPMAPIPLPYPLPAAVPVAYNGARGDPPGEKNCMNLQWNLTNSAKVALRGR